MADDLSIIHMEALRQVLANPMITSPVLAWVAAQVIKTLIDRLRRGRFNSRVLFSPGGMPSAHSALVCGLAASTWFSQGPDSAAFAISAALAVIVMYDAAGVRQAVDRQSEILVHILTHLPRTHDDFDRFLEGLVGHTRLQVVAGALLGIAIAALLR